MTQDIQQDHQPEATPVGHSGTRVVIQERPAWAVSGWFGVLVVAACIAGAILLAQSCGWAGLLVADHRAARPYQGRAVLRQLCRNGA